MKRGRVVHVAIPGRLPFRVVLGGFRAWLLGKLSGHAMMTIRSTVFVRAGVEPTAEGIAHEYVHVYQWSRLGVIRFVARYAYEQVRRGYRANRLEVRAREFAEDRTTQLEFSAWQIKPPNGKGSNG